MVKPLHAGMAARNGVMAARLAQRGFTASPHAIDGPQGYLAAMDSEQASLDPAVADLGIRWEILETGVTVKLYPSCAATHPPLDALIDMQASRALHRRSDTGHRRRSRLDDAAAAHSSKPGDRTRSEVQHAVLRGGRHRVSRLGIDTFDVEHIQNPAVQSLMPRVTLRANDAFDKAAPLSQARVTVHLRDGRVLSQSVDGARGYPGRLTDEELATKFAGCAAAA